MKKFLDDNFLLNTSTAQHLYHSFAKNMPVIDYHCHLPSEQIANDHQFENLTQIWMNGDHYKWRAMRTNGVNESFITGNKSDWEKFQQWAETVPYTVRNPLYHWSHLELQRYFDINEILNPSSAKRVYDHCSELLQTADYSVKNLLRKMNVAIICTTDDPTDSLQYHQQLKKDGFEIPVLPAFRADKAMQIENVKDFNNYVNKLEAVSNTNIGSWNDFLLALKKRHDYFAQNGCNVSDHGLEEVYAADYSLHEINNIFNKLRTEHLLTEEEKLKFRSAVLFELAIWDWEKGWIQQYHLGALRNANTRLLSTLGPDTGWDSIGDFPQARSLCKFLDKLDTQNKLAKTILYNLNPADNELMATMAGNYNDGSIPGKMQFGAAWWFLDQREGMTRQLNALSNMGLISRFVGMITDSRSFLSYPRHEYFRRILCDLFGTEIENGELPDDTEWMGKIIQNICYFNARNYFNWQFLEEKSSVTTPL